MNEIKSTINFSYNWNHKLSCKAFTTLRLSNRKKYIVGEMYRIVLKEKLLKYCQIVEIRNIKYSSLNEFVAYIDTGYSLKEVKEILCKMYPKLKNEENTELMLILLKEIRFGNR